MVWHSSDDVVRVDGLQKRYGATQAVADVSFSVRRGEIFGILGPNGAGKTTTVECMTGLRRADGGTIEVLGLNPVTQERVLRERIGIQLQQANIPDRLRVGEALRLYASFYDHPADTDTLLRDWGLEEKVSTAFANLSGGQKQRLFIALALINTPELVVLDELTTGLDPQARRATWDLVRSIREAGTTVILVTHLMDEAEHLCDRVAVIDKGAVVALDTPAHLIDDVRKEMSIRFTPPDGFRADGLRSLPGVSRAVTDGAEIVVYGSGPLMARVATALADDDIIPPDLRTERATLEDVFIGLTGKEIRA